MKVAKLQFEPVVISRNIFKCKAKYNSSKQNFAICIDKTQISPSISEEALVEKLKAYAKPKNRLHGIGLKLLSSIATVETTTTDSCTVTVTPNVMANIPDTVDPNTKEDKLMDVIIEKVCNGCKHCQNFSKQCELLQRYKSLSYTDLKEYYNLHGVVMSRIMATVLHDHMEVVNRKEKKGNAKRKRTIGRAANFFNFIKEHEGTFFTHGVSTKKESTTTDSTKKRKRKKAKQWNRNSSVSWNVVADVFNNTKYANNDLVTALENQWNKYDGWRHDRKKLESKRSETDKNDKFSNYKKNLL